MIAGRPLPGRPRRARFGALLLLASAALLFPNATHAEVEPALSAEWGRPQGFSANVGLWLGTTPEGRPDVGRGILLQVQPGQHGGALNVGWTPFSLPAWGTQAVGLGVKARLFRSWGASSVVETGRTFAGAEVEAAWIVKLSVGVLRRVGSGSGRATVVTWSVGVGL